MRDPVNYTPPPPGLVVTEVDIEDLTLEERQAFGLTDVRPVEGLLTGNKDLEVFDAR